MAATGIEKRGGNHAVNRRETGGLLIRSRERIEQGFGIGMLRVLEERQHIGSLHDFACVHDHHVTSELRHDPQIVRDQEDGHAHVGLQGSQQVENLGLNGHIEGGGRLIRDEQVGAAGEGHGDHHPLLHPT